MRRTAKRTAALAAAAMIAAPLIFPAAESAVNADKPPVVEEASSNYTKFLNAGPKELLSRFLPQKAEASSRTSPYVVVMECRPVTFYTLRIFVNSWGYRHAIVRAWLDARVRQDCRVVSVVRDPPRRIYVPGDRPGIYVPGEPVPAQPSDLISSVSDLREEIARYYEDLGLGLLTKPGEIWKRPGYIMWRRGFEKDGELVTTSIASTANLGKIIVLYDMLPEGSDVEARRTRNCNALEIYVNPRLKGKTANYIQLPSLAMERSSLIEGLDRGLRGETDCLPSYR
ncbi:MAG: hypothetical protein HYW26_04860 [Candidatus Aenigmarchaeota archaeon]|nr:hypothetical protein [Candidatus Aenigmarchaeota archaeon]